MFEEGKQHNWRELSKFTLSEIKEYIKLQREEDLTVRDREKLFDIASERRDASDAADNKLLDALYDAINGALPNL